MYQFDTTISSAVVDRERDGKATAHIGRQYLANLGKVDNGVVSVTSLYADARLYYPLEVEPTVHVALVGFTRFGDPREVGPEVGPCAGAAGRTGIVGQPPARADDLHLGEHSLPRHQHLGDLPFGRGDSHAGECRRERVVEACRC